MVGREYVEFESLSVVFCYVSGCEVGCFFVYALHCAYGFGTVVVVFTVCRCAVAYAHYAEYGFETFQFVVGVGYDAVVYFSGFFIVHLHEGYVGIAVGEGALPVGCCFADGGAE